MFFRNLSTRSIIGFFCLLLAIISISSITVGPMKISAFDSINSLLLNGNNVAPHIDIVIQQIRLPRTLLCMLIGAILAICGTVTQGLFRNPLAEPGIIGVSSGAMLGAGFAIVTFTNLNLVSAQVTSLIALPMFAFMGGALTTWVVYIIGTSRFGTSVSIMLLAGIAITMLAQAGINSLSFFADDQQLRDISLWSMGSLAAADWPSIGLCTITLIFLLWYFLNNAESLNALLLGEAEASHLGIPVQKLKRYLILMTAFGVGVSVSISGVIGFIGLVIPHLGRMMFGPDHRRLLPISAFLGALLLTLADMLSRIVAAPAELPVGIITALMGAPFFIYLLYKQKGRMT
ncbi:FecCD family ABC transporter permease [Vibrio caribbeanicus]|uniref:FecCD family ABC transporter permease n=1 Tax=Vibrio caribbeanicus TaxID=701175 RepID=UPI002283B05B|nr:iron ABC transporter permease [Vibrio caribbeanicus]MCY9844059.1 iron ABC transporter permease [Vibrio caribbeanicus]